jgi:hypothetical protein
MDNNFVREQPLDVIGRQLESENVLLILFQVPAKFTNITQTQFV